MMLQIFVTWFSERVKQSVMHFLLSLGICSVSMDLF